MITISDEKRLLNLDYFTIYLLLTPEQIQMYGDKLKNVNKHTRITRGLFHVEIIQKGEYAYKELPEDMLRYINDHNFNVLARLVNEIHGNYCYGMESVDVGNPSIFFMLEQFSRNLSYANIKNLDILMNRNTNSGREAMRIYNESNIAMELFQDAFVCNIGKFKRWTKDEVPNLFESADTKTSSELVEEAVGNSKPNTIKREPRERELPDAPPEQLTITIKRIRVKQKRNTKIAFGFEINVDGDIIPVYFGATDRTFHYAATLMRQKEGLSPLTRTNYMYLADTQNNEIKNWLRSLFKTLNLNTNFDKWCEIISDSEAHRLDNATSVIKRILWEALSPKHENAFYYCLLRNDDGRYKINIRKENIFIDKEITDRMQKR
jgi:hypothetical protein